MTFAMPYSPLSVAISNPMPFSIPTLFLTPLQAQHSRLALFSPPGAPPLLEAAIAKARALLLLIAK